ncbi:hypothetical protein [Mediterraneibacter glycyrrhizinilyticus]|uniref:hypothetical protein n=1 Tax=Mediterraneibacter glycyrrhizinilyticus TaxID=342942 RepID=UPI0025A4A357|nr:hypothetical protein [Mediterraneibacter glycyrrhizinilyticus]MDM8211539.1 hypothetical protein [Mediterraneibacter glycyrrhizinilyticus]
MRLKLFKRVSAVLLTLVLLGGLMPATAFAADPVENTAPAVEDFATVEQLQTGFDMDDSTSKTFKQLYFGNKTWQWSIAGVDPAGGGLVLLFGNSPVHRSYFSSSTDIKDYDPAWGIEYEDGFVPEKVSSNNYGASEMRTVFQSYTESGNSACIFTDAQLGMIIPTNIYTADYYNADNDGNPRVYHSMELLYPTYSTDYRPSPDRIQFVTVGSNSAEELGTELKVSLKENVSNSFTRSPYSDYDDRVLLNTSLGVEQRTADDDRWGYLPVFQLDTSNVLFGSIYKGVTAEGEQKDTYGRKIFTLRLEANNLGKAYVTETAQEYVTVEDAPEGTYLVAQCGEGAWAKAVSGDMTFSASDISDGEITTFENCKVWLEKTDADSMLTYASYADKVSAYSVSITGNTKLVRDENSGAENQVSLDNAPITDIVYSTVEDYYFPEDYCDNLSNNGITVARNSDTQITISGIPTADVYVTLSMPGYRGTKDQWDGVTVASGYESGDGTQDNPYVIANSEQFAYFARQMESEDYNGAGEYFVLTADLELTAADWNPIFRFDGSFDGNGHTIVYTQREGMVTTNDVNQQFYYFGLFGIQRGTVSNLNVSGDILVSVPAGVTIADLNVGGICGYTRGTVTHCSSDVDIRFEEGANLAPNVGGIAGQIDNDAKAPGVVEYCGCSGSIDGNIRGAKAGGIAGHMRGGTIRQCFNKGTIDLTGAGGIYAGGIIGSIYDMNYTKTRVIESCYNWGTISAAAAGSGTANAGGIGGILNAKEGSGDNYSDASAINGCYSIGTLSSSSGDTSPLSPDVGGHVKVSGNYCLEGEDANVQKAEDKTELFEKLRAYALNTWFADSQTGDVRLLWELAVPAEPNAVFNADGEDSGVLSDVAAGMKYSLDGGVTWMDITDTTVSLSGVTPENGVQVYMPGDMHETNDSAVQTITVTKASVPDSVGAKDCTTTSQNDGMLIGLDNTMEYKAADGDVWISVTGKTVTGLKPGTYLVRVKAEGTKLASASAEVTIRAYTGTTAAESDTDGGNTQSPRTGDSVNILFWFSIVLAAGAVLTGTTFYRRIKCKK